MELLHIVMHANYNRNCCLRVFQANQNQQKKNSISNVRGNEKGNGQKQIFNKYFPFFSTFDRIFVNRSLHLENIKFYGFDMDYTLAGS